MSRVKMRHCHNLGDAALMRDVRDELAELMGRVIESDSPRHAPLYAAWAAADVCARDLVELAEPHPEMSLDDRSHRGRPELADISRLKHLYDRVHERAALTQRRDGRAAAGRGADDTGDGGRVVRQRVYLA